MIKEYNSLLDIILHIQMYLEVRDIYISKWLLNLLSSGRVPRAYAAQ